MRNPSNEVEIERDVKVEMPDGVVLLTDVYHPVGVGDAPTLLERTPYGREGVVSSGTGPEFAARGYRYIVQACRGTDGSAGTHSYFAEAPDGRATADWIAEQPWFNGRFGSYGASYMGFTQWALASTRPPYLQAMAVALSTSVRKFSWYPGDSLALEVIIPWDLGAVMFNQPGANAIVDEITPEAIEQRMNELRVVFDHLPLGDVIRHVTGVDLPLYQDQLLHSDADDPFWRAVDFRAGLSDWTVPTLLVDGWHDYPLPGVLEDYAILRDAPAPVRLRIGAGGHLGGGGEGGMTDAPLDWFDTYLRDEPGLLPDRPVTVQVQGEGGEWRDFDDWPPAADLTTWCLHPDGRLASEAPTTGAGPDHYRYDPADPTPAAGGIGMLTGGPVDNRAVEARADVLVFTSDELTEPLELIGPVSAELHVTSSLDHVDFFVRVCDVHPDGASFNVCDGLQRFGPTTITRAADGTFVAPITLWPIGHRFGAGHRVRVQVSSGSHPVYARNLGTGEPATTATEMRVANVAVLHEPGHLSAVTLPHVRG
jgi:putative CocE/NonD family hydrolase